VLWGRARGRDALVGIGVVVAAVAALAAAGALLSIAVALLFGAPAAGGP
jgi:hypothetical protein